MGKLSRRQLLKTGLIGTGALAFNQALASVGDRTLELGGQQVSRTSGRIRSKVASTCLNCYARCGIFGYSSDGMLAKLSGIPGHPNNRGRMCAKGQAGVNLIYDPDRILRPMRRVGARGEGKWEPISWRQAIDEVAVRMRDLAQSGRQSEFVLHSTRDVTAQGFARRFCHAFGSPNALVNTPLGGWNKALAQLMTWGSQHEINDVANTEYMLLFGANPFEAHILRTSFVQRITEGRLTKIAQERVHHGAKMVTFDPRLSQTAGKSDEWFPIRPGTDAAVALAMCNVIMRHGLHDREFLDKWTNYSAEKLQAHLARFTPEFAEAESGVPAADIERIALEFASSKPSTTVSTGGVTKHRNGVYNERAIMLLNAVAGNIDVRGGYCLPRTIKLAEPSPIPPPPSAKSPFAQSAALGVFEGEAGMAEVIESGKARVGLYMCYRANPCYEFPNTKRVQNIFSDEKLMPYIVAIDSYPTETAMMADLILPDAMYLETLELETPPAMDLVPFVSLRQPVVQARGLVRPVEEILIEIAKAIGGETARYFNFQSYSEYLDAEIASVKPLIKAGGMSYLEDHGFWVAPTKPEYQRFKKTGFGTPSGKFEVYSERLAAAGFDPLPTYSPLMDASSLKDNEFTLITHQWNVHTHSRTADSMWLSEIVHDNPLLINADVGERLGLKTGDEVRVTSKTGSLKVKVRLTEGINPKAVAISDSVGHWEYGRVAQAKSFESNMPETEHIWWRSEGKGVHPHSLIADDPDPMGHGQSWMDTTVRIERV
ncbi:MAG: molybdopterin-dependent oxidoreductase [Armatimonadota bacterium]|nr:molybdopterin-dependent oxidoreductase [Armatimonadota bacterium]